MARVGSAVGPAAAGFLFAGGMERSGVTAILGLGCLVAAALLLFFRVSGNPEQADGGAVLRHAPAE
jgi:hypothetical protein